LGLAERKAHHGSPEPSEATNSKRRKGGTLQRKKKEQDGNNLLFEKSTAVATRKGF